METVTTEVVVGPKRWHFAVWRTPPRANWRLLVGRSVGLDTEPVRTPMPVVMMGQPYGCWFRRSPVYKKYITAKVTPITNPADLAPLMHSGHDEGTDAVSVPALLRGLRALPIAAHPAKRRQFSKLALRRLGKLEIKNSDYE